MSAPYDYTITAIQQKDLVSGMPDQRYVNGVVIDVNGMSGTASFIPQIIYDRQGKSNIQPVYRNVAWRNAASKVGYAAGTAITTDGTYSIESGACIPSLNITDVGDGEFTVSVTPLQGAFDPGGSTTGGGGPITVADGADVALGSTTDAATGDANGTANGHTRMSAKAASQGAADNSANSTFKAPVLTGTANAAAPSWTEGRQVPLSTDLAGNLRSILAASAAYIGHVGGTSPAVAVEITRPADTTAYAVNDSVNTSTSTPTIITFAGASRINSGTGRIIKARLTTDQSACVAQMRLWIFNSATPQLSNDNAAFLIKYADKNTRLGYFDLPALATEAGSDCAEALLDKQLFGFTADSGANLYGLLETKTVFTPASAQKFNITLTFDQD